MTNRLNYYWRLLATAGCFAAFGLGGLVLSVFVFPVLLLSPEKSRTQRARWVIHKAFAAFMGLMEALGIMRFEVIGAQHLRESRNTLVLANHPSLIDVVAMVSLMPQVSCVVKQALWHNPFMAGAVRAAGYVKNSAPETLISDCANDLALGNPLIIFPEGTRTQPGQALNFLRGAAHIAIKSGLPILPVLIDCAPSTLTKREKWYNIPRRRFHLRIEVLAPIHASQWIEANAAHTIAARQLTQALETFFTQELERDGRS